MKEQEKLLREIMCPGTEFTPIPFWFFNDAFEEEKVKNQLMDYVEKGVNGIVLHPRIGVPKEMPYLSEEYFKAVRYIVKTAAGLGMKVVLYDEGMYPSGSAHGMVVQSNPEYASKGIILLDEEKAREKLAAEKTAQVIATLSDGRKIIYGFNGGTIRGIHFGEDDGQPGAPKAADILNPDAVDEFIRLTHDKYYEELKEYFGATVIAFFTDEPSALGRNSRGYKAWARGMEKEIEEAGGRLEDLEGLFIKTGKTVAGRADIAEHVENPTVRLYRQLIKKKLREIFYARLSGWCEKHGIGLIGHPAESNDIEEELYFHIPGQDLIMRRVAPETGGLREFDSVQAKLSADIARHLGRRRNANECFGVCYRDKIPWYMTAGDMKWYIDWLGLRGVNLYIPHAFYYSVEGERKGERPPDVGPNNIWWKHYHRFSDYMKRLSYLMSDSVNGAEFAVLCDNNKAPYEEIACLYENQIEFNYLPAALLEEAQVRDGRVCLQGYAYQGVLNVLGQEYEDRFGEKLGGLLWNVPMPTAGKGGSVASDEAGKKEARENVEAAVLSVVRQKLCARGQETGEVNGKQEKGSLEGRPLFGEVKFDVPCAALRKIALHKDGTDMLLFGNEGSEPVTVNVTVPRMESPLFVDLWRGICYQVEGAGEEFPISLRPSETVLVVSGVSAQDMEKGSLSREGAGESALCMGADESAALGEADENTALGKARDAGFGSISVECRKAGWYKAEYPDWTNRFELVEKKDNEAVYSMKYIVPEAEAQSSGNLSASLEKAPLRFAVNGEEMVECFCNGEFVDVSFWGEHRFDVGQFLKEGENELRLVITGNAANIYENAGIAFGLKA